MAKNHLIVPPNKDYYCRLKLVYYCEYTIINLYIRKEFLLLYIHAHLLIKQ